MFSRHRQFTGVGSWPTNFTTKFRGILLLPTGKCEQTGLTASCNHNTKYSIVQQCNSGQLTADIPNCLIETDTAEYRASTSCGLPSREKATRSMLRCNVDSAENLQIRKCASCSSRSFSSLQACDSDGLLYRSSCCQGHVSIQSFPCPQTSCTCTCKPDAGPADCI